MAKRASKELIRQVGNPSKLKEVVTNLLKSKIGTALDKKKEELKRKSLKEGALETLQGIVQGNAKKAIKFSNGQQLSVDHVTANMLLKVHAALKNPDMKAKFEKMLQDNPASFMKLVDFGWKQVG